MNRDVWTFSYPADKLLEAAGLKKGFHTDRLDYWTTKRKETEGKIRAEGIEIDESVAAGDVASYLSNTTSWRGGGVTIRDDLLRDLQECVGKQKEHRDKVKNYDAWAQVLASQGATHFNLHQDDWLFFFGI